MKYIQVRFLVFFLIFSPVETRADFYCALKGILASFKKKKAVPKKIIPHSHLGEKGWASASFAPNPIDPDALSEILDQAIKRGDFPVGIKSVVLNLKKFPATAVEETLTVEGKIGTSIEDWVSLSLKEVESKLGNQKLILYKR